MKEKFFHGIPHVYSVIRITFPCGEEVDAGRRPETMQVMCLAMQGVIEKDELPSHIKLFLKQYGCPLAYAYVTQGEGSRPKFQECVFRKETK